MNALFSGKNLPEVTIAILIVAVILLFASIFTAASGVKKVISTYKESASIPVAIPLLAISIQPYTKAEYDIVQAKIKPAGGVKIESSGNKLTITSLDVMCVSLVRLAFNSAAARDCECCWFNSINILCTKERRMG
jgi:hypothetical protein